MLFPAHNCNIIFHTVLLKKKKKEEKRILFEKLKLVCLVGWQMLVANCCGG